LVLHLLSNLWLSLALAGCLRCLRIWNLNFNFRLYLIPRKERYYLKELLTSF
jgi:hypothetical protein